MKKIQIAKLLLIVLFLSFKTNLFSQEIATRAEIHDYDIGDVFHYRDHGLYGAGQGGFLKWINDTVIDKYYSQNDDTLFYLIKRHSLESTDENPNWTYQEFTYTKPISNLDSLINYGNIDTVYSGPNAFNGRLINKQEYTEYFTSNWDPDSTVYVKKWVVGCGLVLNYNEDFPYWDKEEFRLKYYKKGDEEWGEEVLILNMDENLLDNIEIWPNPAQDKLYVDLGSSYEDYISLEVIGINGAVLVIKTIQHEKLIELNIRNLDKGLYTIRLLSNTNSIQKKIVKN